MHRSEVHQAQDSPAGSSPRASPSGRDPRVAAILALQRSAGNRAVLRALRAAPATPERRLQRKNWFTSTWAKIRTALGGGGAAPAAAVPQAPAPPVAQTTPYPGTNIVIRDTGAYQNGNFTAKVTADLDAVQLALGNNFMTAPPGKRQTIIFDNGLNYCRGGNAGYTELRDMHQSGNRAQFGQELNLAMTHAGVSTQALATRLLNTQLPHWNNTQAASPFQTDGQAGTEAKIAAWLAATSPLPSYDEVDVMSIALEGSLRAGPGCGVIIAYDPDLVNAGAGAGTRPPAVALAHELTHAYYYARGTQMGAEDSSSELSGGRLFELMAVGMAPFTTAAYSENRMRAASGVGARVQYP